MLRKAAGNDLRHTVRARFALVLPTTFWGLISDPISEISAFTKFRTPSRVRLATGTNRDGDIISMCRTHVEKSGIYTKTNVQRLQPALFSAPQERYQQLPLVFACSLHQFLLVRGEEIGSKRMIAWLNQFQVTPETRP